MAYTPKLTHGQRKERRTLIAEALRSGKTTVEAAVEFGVSSARVYDAAREHGIKIRQVRRSVPLLERVGMEKWQATDWSLRNGEIAEQLGVTPERVRQVRILLNKPRAKYHKCHSSGVKIRAWLNENRDRVSGLTVKFISECVPFDVDLGLLYRACEDLGIEIGKCESISNLVTRENLTNFVTQTSGPLDSPCWLWNFSKTKAGYGILAGGSRYAHRFVFELFNGPIPEGLWCLHKCDTPKCVNPAHLYAGTPKDNTRDAITRGRFRPNKLDGDAIKSIRESFKNSESSVKELAAKHGVCVPTIYRVLRGGGKLTELLVSQVA